MKTSQYLKSIYVAMLMIASSLPVIAKGYEATLASDPDGCVVYLNGVIVAQTTPTIINLDKKMIDKNLMFRFEKKGYDTKTVIVNLDKKALKKSPIIYAKLDQLAPSPQQQEAARIRKQDPTIPKGQETARVSRDNAGATSMEQSIIRWYFDSDPRGARIYYRVISNNPAEVKNTNEAYLMTTPYEETKGFSIPGLTYENSRNVTIEIKVSKKGYADQVKRYNVRQALDQQEISGFFELVPTDTPE